MHSFLTTALGLVGIVLLGSTPQQAGTVLSAEEMAYPNLTRVAPVQGRDWLGLYTSDEGSRLEAVAVRWDVTEEFGDSVFTLVVAPASPTLIVADVPGLAPGPATSLTSFEQFLEADLPRTFVLGNRTYSVELSGTAPNMCDAAVTVSDGTVEQRLGLPEIDYISCDAPHFSIQWAGDIDGDGQLDLLVTISPKYSFYPRRLYLSSAAGEDELVGLVAALDGAAA